MPYYLCKMPLTPALVKSFPNFLPFPLSTTWMGRLSPFDRLVELSRDPHKVLFILPMQILKSMCSSALTLRNILDGQGDADAGKEMLKSLQIFYSSSRWK